MPQRIHVVPYDPAWERLFNEEAALISQIIGPNLDCIHHIGSTAVLGLCAKPIIDMLPVVSDLSAVDSQTDAFSAVGYEAMGEFGIPGRRYFRKGGDRRTHQLHIFEKSNVREIERHLAFRDYLRAHPKKAYEYGALKSRLAAQYPNSIDRYCDGKDQFVRQTERAALLWRRGQTGAAFLNE
ncbi:GrpB family protein [Anaerotruncus colihominis]|uniref:GrpB family protein n=1 Tax=Anaerotruncus colihominis TaxID=169435 RepID=A0A845RK44_9FIRM|nr:GrpB family protein [Anaerotruncus colihominis]NBI79933.1 GrpB family protein [Anaerotruncus colihominis]